MKQALSERFHCTTSRVETFDEIEHIGLEEIDYIRDESRPFRYRKSGSNAHAYATYNEFPFRIASSVRVADARLPVR
jgi:hypothetical protein